MLNKYFAELLGTFTLSFVVLVAVSVGNTVIPIPVIVGLTLALFVYSIGSVSGCHINPSVTLAQLSVGKISSRNAVGYIVAQLIGAFLAILVAQAFQIVSHVAPGVFSTKLFFAEMVGAILFNFGIASVVYGKAASQMSGLVVGGSLLLGVIVASMIGALGILNPAVALALNVLTVTYLFAPVVGAIIGFQLYKYVAGE